MKDLGLERALLGGEAERIEAPARRRFANRKGQRAAGRALVVSTLVASLGLSACSSVPDALNPAEWYRSTVDLFSGDDEAKAGDTLDQQKMNELAKARGTAPPGADQNFPTLGSVARKKQARDNLKGGLVADPNRPKYAPAIARQGEAASSLAARPPAPPAPSVTAAAPTQPAPPPQPKAPVATAQPSVTPAPATQTAAATPPPMPSSSTTSEPMNQQQLAERLQKRLAEIRARSQVQGSLLTVNAPLLAGGGGSTVIVSSGGIETGNIPISSPGPVAMAPVGALAGSGDNRGALPIPYGAVRVATIQFRNGSSSLNARERQILASVSQLQRQRGGKVRIVGHASARTRAMDPVRHKMVNFQVSIQRADMVAKALVGMGVKADDVLIAAVGDEQPLYHEVMSTGEAGNRRAEVYLSN